MGCSMLPGRYRGTATKLRPTGGSGAGGRWWRAALPPLIPIESPLASSARSGLAPRASRCRVDRLDDRDGQLVVVDYKTGRRPLSIDDARGSLALALYALAAAATLRRPCVRVELHHLPTGDVHAFEHTDESLRRQLGRAEQIADEALAAVAATSESSGADAFPPRPGAQCGWCDFRAHCPEGAAAAPARLPWAALGEPESVLGEPESVLGEPESL
jgi:RecB family exonuclease